MKPVTEEELIERTTAPRVTEQDLLDNISAEYVYNVHDALVALGMPAHDALKMMTFAVLVLKNGFVVTGQSATADPTNFKPDVGARLAYTDAKNKIWPLMGYALKQEVYLNGDGTFKGRMEREARELEDKITKLKIFIEGDTFKSLTSEQRELMWSQRDAMVEYLHILKERITKVI